MSRFVIKFGNSPSLETAYDGRCSSVLTDVAGTRPIYYMKYRNGVVWASAATPLAELSQARVDDMALLAQIICPTVGKMTGTTTSFTGIHLSYPWV